MTKQEIGKRYREKHKEKERLRKKKYNKEHKEQNKISNKKYNEKNKELRNNYSKEYHLLHKEEQRKYRLLHRGYRQKYHRKKTYGIDDIKYKEMLIIQNYVCALCKNPEKIIYKGILMPLCIDHNHKTGKVRGLLCRSCNLGLGYFNENVEILEAGINYIKQYE